MSQAVGEFVSECVSACVRACVNALLRALERFVWVKKAKTKKYFVAARLLVGEHEYLD